MFTMHNVKSSSKRAVLFKVACLSLFTSSMGFATYSSPASLPLHVSTSRMQDISEGRNRIFTLNMVPGSATFPSEPRLSLEEEKELLRQAVEMRRINTLESEMMMRSTSRSKPLLLDRAMAAGYGEELDAYENAMRDGQRARELLVTRNMGLVHYCIQQTVGKREHLNSLSREDLVQEGAIGLARAVDKWNPAIGGKFSTYAVYWIRAAVLRCIAERDDMLRVPVHVTQAVRNIDKAAKLIGIDLTSDNWRKANVAKQLAVGAGLTDKNFEEAMKVRSRRYGGGYVAFDCWMQKGRNLGSDVPNLERPEEGPSSIETEHLRTTLSKYLRPREMEALSWRYGLVNETSETPQAKANRYLVEVEEELFASPAVAQSEMTAKGRWGEAMTFNEVGKKMKVSAEYGRRLCHAALGKLRTAAEEGRLEPALLV
jgi:RNA polymerase sigma factor (sigma-70 family)